MTGASGVVDGLYRWVDNRLNVSGSGRKWVNKIFPDHWSFLIGEIALYSFVILLATGVFLSLYFVPSGKDIVYNGPYLPLKGVTVSQAYASTIDLSFSVRAGLLMRQMHHWAANIFLGAIVVHLCRVYFTSAFRRPRELNWIIGVNLLILAIFNGFLGYSLPDDLVSGTGIRIAFSILESVPIVGSYLATFLFGGSFPGSGIIIPRFFIIHVLILPAIIAGLLGAHLALIVRNKHTQYRGNGATEHNVIGAPLWPTFFAKTNGFLFLIAGVTALLGAFVQINPIWLYGPYIPYHVTYAVQPDWYMGWLDGALRIMPSWEIHLPGHMIPNAFFPSVLLPGITFTLLIVWPLIEQRLTKDKLEHHLLERPRDRPVHTALGAAVLAFYFVLFGASATDVLANYLSLSLNVVLWSFRIAVIVVPIIVYPIVYRICVELQQTPGGGKRKRHNIVLRDAEGGYSTVVSAPRPGDEPVVLEPLALDTTELVGAGVGPDGQRPATTPGGAAAAEAASQRRGRDGDGSGRPDGTRGIFRIPRNYR